jgi:hypothetical protein
MSQMGRQCHFADRLRTGAVGQNRKFAIASRLPDCGHSENEQSVTSLHQIHHFRHLTDRVINGVLHAQNRDDCDLQGQVRPQNMQSPPAAIAEAVSRELLGEHVLWAASPDRWAYASKYWKTALFGIPFTAFALFWTYGVCHIPAKSIEGVAIFFPLWGLMFVLFGLSMLLSPIWAAWTAGSVYYVVTERRAIIFEKSFKLNIKSFPRSSVAGYERVTSGGAAGSIIFQWIIYRSGKGTRIREIGFIGLSEYASAEQALNKLLEGGGA